MDLSSLNLPALAIAVVLALLLVGLLLYAARISQPGYYQAEREPGGPPTGVLAMERKVLATTAMVVAMFLMLLGYGFREPARQAVAAERLLDTSIGRGIGLYTTLCYTCHGEKGQGALVPIEGPERVAPALNRADLRPTDPDERKKKFDFIYKTIQRGRPNTPMPPWGTTDGGTLFDEQLNELTFMILNGDREIEFEGRKDKVWGHVEHVIKQHLDEGLISSLPKQPQVENQPFYQALTDPQKQGVRAALQRGCGGCHVIPNIPGAAGVIGPSLEGVANRRQIAGGVVPNNSVDDMARWIQNPPGLKPGTAMPNLGIPEPEARQIAEFLYTLK